MISASLYSTLFPLIVLFLSYGVLKSYSSMPDWRIEYPIKEVSYKGWILAFLFAIWIGYRPVSGYYFVDMANYNEGYLANLGVAHKFDLDAENFLFDNLMLGMASQMWDVQDFFFVIALIYFVGTFVAMNKLFPQDSYLGFITFLGAFSTYSYGTNGIKAGAAAAIFLCAIAYWHKILLCALLLYASWGFHHSMIMPIAAFVICYFYKNPKVYLWVWIICVVISALHITYFQELFAGMTEGRQQSYLNSVDTNWGGKQGFRIDFVLYSAVPIVIGYYILFKQKKKSEDYTFIFNLYALINSIWMLCMYASFTNRIAYLSWLMYPVVLIYPFLKMKICPNQYDILIKIVWGHLLFTLFMIYIYY